MTEQTITEPVRVAVRVAAPPQRAFDAFTQEFAAWWPLGSHHIGEQDAETVIIEPGEGGAGSSGPPTGRSASGAAS